MQTAVEIIAGLFVGGALTGIIWFLTPNLNPEPERGRYVRWTQHNGVTRTGRVVKEPVDDMRLTVKAIDGIDTEEHSVLRTAVYYF